MAKYRCNVCGHIVDAMLFRCPNCNAMGKGFTEVREAEADPPPQPPTPIAPPAETTPDLGPTLAASPVAQPEPKATPATEDDATSPAPTAPQARTQAEVPKTPTGQAGASSPTGLSPVPTVPEARPEPPQPVGPPPDVPPATPPAPSPAPELDQQPVQQAVSAPEVSTGKTAPTGPPAPPPAPPIAPPQPSLKPVDVSPSEAKRRAPKRLAWRFSLSGHGADTRRPLRGCPALDSQGRCFVAIDNQLLMFPTGESSPQWNYSTGGPIPASPAVGPDGNLRVHSCDGYLHVIDPQGQRVFEPVAVGEPLGWATPLVDAHGNTWICRREGGLVKVDASGQTASRPFFRTRRRFDCSGLIHDEILYLGCEDHYLYAIPLSGERGENAWGGSVDRGRTAGAIHCPVVLADGPVLIAASQDDHLYCFTLDGKNRWTVRLPGQVLGSPVIDGNGTVYVGIIQNPRSQNARGMVIAVDGVTRKTRWQYATDAPVEGTPVIGDDGTMYFGDNSGTIHAVDTNGDRIWTAELEAPVRSAGTFLGDRLVAFGLDSGSLVVLECSSQHLTAAGWPKFRGTLNQSGLVPTA